MGLLAFIISVAGSHNAWFWADEAATISLATRPLPQLWNVLQVREIAHGAYYLIMHIWFEFVPVNEFTSRIVSSLAVGLAAAGVVVFGRQTSNQTVAIIAGVTFALLPRVTWAGSEARIYALSMMAAIWLTVACVEAARRAQPIWWLLYGAGVAAAVILFVWTIFLLPAHAAAVWTTRKGGRKHVDSALVWRSLRAWAATLMVVTAIVSPFLVLIRRQAEMLSWVPRPQQVFTSVTRDQYFGSGDVPAKLAGSILVAGIVVALLRGVRKPSTLVLIASLWVAVPTVALITYSFLVLPVYVDRHLSFTVPALALLIGSSIAMVSSVGAGNFSKITAGALLLIFATSVLPDYRAQRSTLGKGLSHSMDYAPVADIIERYGSHGDCLAVDDSPDPERWWPLRWMLIPRPKAYEKLNDVGRIGDPGLRGELLSANAADYLTRLADSPDCFTVWSIVSADATLPGHQWGDRVTPGPRLAQTKIFETLRQSGFRLEESWQFRTAQVAKMVRGR